MHARGLGQKYQRTLSVVSDFLCWTRGAWTPQARPYEACLKHVINVCLLKLTYVVKLVRRNTGNLASHILFNGAIPRENYPCVVFVAETLEK